MRNGTVIAIWITLTLLFAAACATPEPSETLIGYVEGEFVYIAPPQSGFIHVMLVKQGDIVVPGDTLFELDKDQEQLIYAEAEGRLAQADAQRRNIETGARPEELAELGARLDEAMAQLAYAQGEYDRLIPLVEKGFISQAEGNALTVERDLARARVQTARDAVRVAELSGREAELEAAEAAMIALDAVRGQTAWRLEKRTMRTQVDGRVEYVFHRLGEFVTAGSPVLAILPDDAVKIRFFIPQADLPRVQLGSVIQVSADGIVEPIDARVSFIAREAEFTPPVIYSVESREKLVFMVEARVPPTEALRPGLPVEVHLK